MKYITFTVPCYNSESYMQRCIDSLLPGGKDVEIIIVNDGSTDRTGEIADRYASQYPEIVRVVHKENGGHGSGVNTGMELASGYYFKVVDSDDWLDQKAYKSLLEKIKQFINMKKTAKRRVPDLFICNYVYDHYEEQVQKVMRYTNVFPEERMCRWENMGHFRPSQYLIMHALIYRTSLLRASELKLPEHMFYVDNLFAYKPLPLVKNIYYMNIDLYHYYLGREDQSVNEQVLIKRIDQQIYVTEQVSKCVDLEEVRRKSPKLADYMKRNISIMLSISGIHLLLMNTEEGIEKRRKLWEAIRKNNRKLYYLLKYTTISGFTYLPGRTGGLITVKGYRLANQIYKFQ